MRFAEIDSTKQSMAKSKGSSPTFAASLTRTSCVRPVFFPTTSGSIMFCQKTFADSLSLYCALFLGEFHGSGFRYSKLGRVIGSGRGAWFGGAGRGFADDSSPVRLLAIATDPSAGRPHERTNHDDSSETHGTSVLTAAARNRCFKSDVDRRSRSTVCLSKPLSRRCRRIADCRGVGQMGLVILSKRGIGGCFRFTVPSMGRLRHVTPYQPSFSTATKDADNGTIGDSFVLVSRCPVRADE